MSQIKITKEQEELLKEHYLNPKNFGKMDNYDAKGICKNLEKNAEVTIFLKINQENIVKDIKFLFKGCKSILFSGSLFTDTVKGETIQEGTELCHELLTQLESDLSPDKEKPRLVMHAFLAAISNLEDRKNGIKENEKMKIIYSFKDISKNTIH